jgi:NAD(P)H-dependent FMN reductase
MHDNHQLRVTIIIGSTRQGRFAPTVARWFGEQATRRDDLTIDLVDRAEAQLPDVLTTAPGSRVETLRERLSQADAFVIVTPEYNHSFPASLKNAIDWYSKEWRAKPVAFVSYGGLAGGLRAVEQLRQVFAELHAVTIRDTVSFHGVWSQFDSAGRLQNPDDGERAAKAMLDRLTWWGWALRDARVKRPYAA